MVFEGLPSSAVNPVGGTTEVPVHHCWMGAGGPKVRGHGAMVEKPMGNPWESHGKAMGN